jgi:hypothetical protein
MGADVIAQERTAEYRMTNNERRRNHQKSFNFIIRYFFFDIRHSGLSFESGSGLIPAL